jgi:hypothetical protein
LRIAVPSPLLRNCHGSRPAEVFEDFFPGGIAAMDLACEARTLLVASRSGHLSLLNDHGERLIEEFQYAGVSRIVWADSGDTGAAVMGDDRLLCFDHKLKPLWDARITGRITGLAIAPHGSHIAFATDSARIHIVSADRREVAKFDTVRPLEHLKFYGEMPRLLAAAEQGQMCCYDLQGREIWHERILNNAGDLCLSEPSRRIFMAAFNHGVQVFESDGTVLGAYALDGIPSRVSASRFHNRVAVMTLENRIFWLNFEGTIQWVADLSVDPPEHIQTGPLADRLWIATTSGCLLALSWP